MRKYSLNQLIYTKHLQKHFLDKNIFTTEIEHGVVLDETGDFNRDL